MTRRGRRFLRQSRDMFRIAILTLFLTGTVSGDEGKSLSASVSRYLESRESAFPSEAFRDEDREEILHRPDPETQFLYYAFGLKKHAAKLLSPDQALALNAVIEKHAPVHSRWHDERNTVRCYWNRLLWIHAGADQGEAEKIHAELAIWMDLRIQWTRQEHLAQYRFARDVWDVLTSEQQEKLLSGAWKSYAKQGTGHSRGDATAKIITRALGKPDDAETFASAVAAWSTERVPLHQALTDAENRERRIVFAMDRNSASMADAAAVAETDTYSALYLAEADSIRRIVQAAYREPQDRCAKAAEEGWKEAEQRFHPGAADLIQLLATP